ncbi:hemin-degrading factor [Cochlodiniinecator piscidefendens]|uniref:hemin-degrading factor n=1 Tax=Cochlodiniinecator piscidefendens TaxID=2715756 RepID=UPI00140C19C0|nr:ChuX/HutX family heme-like substrate-binding protein [Cochlodiniinecator piscidefendens]
MLDTDTKSPESIRVACVENPKMRERDLAHKLGISEAELVAAHVGHGAIRINAHPDAIMKQAEKLGEVLALTRNESCVIERVGVYDNYHSGAHAAMILNSEIDLRIFAKFWVSAFAVEKKTESGVRRSLQVFSGTGMAMHKIHLRDDSNHAVWEDVVSALRLDDQSDSLEVKPRGAPEEPKADPAKADQLRAGWDDMTDTHQFMRLTSRLKMNRLGAYRIVGAPYVKLMENEAVERALEKISERKSGVMVFVGNRGCIQIHGGLVETLRPMGPWINVMDERFNLHLRGDHIAETYVVTKPTQQGDAVSLEAFDAEGRIILQIFPDRRSDENNAKIWDEIVAELPQKGADA